MEKKKVTKNEGFTLIELLAVIIILGILMIIAIPSVTKYINDSRKSAYVDTANEVIGAARNLVNSGKEEMYDTDATYYLDVKCIGTENAMKSPYGEFVELGAFVVVTYNGKGYDYYWTSVDDSGQGIKDIIKSDKLDVDDIESDLSIDDIKTNRTIDGRSKVILITERNQCRKEGAITENLIQVSSSGENSSNNVVVYPEGKTKETVEPGDIVKIDTEEFYVVKHDGNDLILLSHYNLKVGNIYDNSGTTKLGEYTSDDEGYGKQSSDVKGSVSKGNINGTVAFSSTNYWSGLVGTHYPGVYCTYSYSTNCAYVYDNNSILYQYINNYKTYLQSLGVTIKDARLMSLEESNNFKNIKSSAWIETSYWLGSVRDNDTGRIWGIITASGFVHGYHAAAPKNYGVRPVIII